MTEKEVDSIHATIECEQPQPDLYKSVQHTHICSQSCQNTLATQMPGTCLHLLYLSQHRFVGRVNIYMDNEPVAR